MQRCPAGIVVALSLALIGGPGLAQVSCNRFAIRYRLEADGKVNLRLETDLPSDVKVTYEVSRRYWTKGSKENRTLEYVVRTESVGVLSDGIDLDVSDAAFEARRLALSTSDRPAEVDRVDRKLRVKMMTPSGINRDLLGERNAKLGGSAVVKEDGVLLARSVLSIDLEMKTKQNEGVKPRDKGSAAGEIPLAAGIVYRVRQATSLLPVIDLGVATPRGSALPLEVGVILRVDRQGDVDGHARWRVSRHAADGAFESSFWVDNLPVAALEVMGPSDRRDAVLKGLPDGFAAPPEHRPVWRFERPIEILASEGAATRARAAVAVPEGLEAEALLRQIRLAVFEIGERSGAAAVELEAFRPGLPRDGAATAARASLSGRRAEAEILPSYFVDASRILPVGSRVEFVSEDAAIPLDAAAEARGLGKPVGKVTAGGRGRLLASRVIIVDGRPLIRYEVSSDSGLTGWLDADLVKAL